MRGKTSGACMFIKMQDLIAAKMVFDNQTKVYVKDLYQFAKQIGEKMSKQSINGVVLYSNVYLRDFAREYEKQFYVDNEIVALREGMGGRDYILDEFILNMPLDKMELFGFLEDEKETSV